MLRWAGCRVLRRGAGPAGLEALGVRLSLVQQVIGARNPQSTEQGESRRFLSRRSVSFAATGFDLPCSRAFTSFSSLRVLNTHETLPWM